MTSNERKILECIRDHGGKAHIQHVVHRTKLSSGYSLFLCRSLAKAGHLEFVNPNVCKLAEKGCGHFQDRAGTEVVVASFTLQEESTDDPALSKTISDDKDDESQEDENIGEANKDQKVRPDPAVQQADSGAGEKRDDDIDKKLEELFPKKNDSKHKEGAGEKPIINPIDNMGLMIKRFVGLLKGAIKSSHGS